MRIIKFNSDDIEIIIQRKNNVCAYNLLALVVFECEFFIRRCKEDKINYTFDTSDWQYDENTNEIQHIFNLPSDTMISMKYKSKMGINNIKDCDDTLISIKLLLEICENKIELRENFDNKTPYKGITFDTATYKY